MSRKSLDAYQLNNKWPEALLWPRHAPIPFAEAHVQHWIQDSEVDSNWHSNNLPSSISSNVQKNYVKI